MRIILHKNKTVSVDGEKVGTWGKTHGWHKYYWFRKAESNKINVEHYNIACFRKMIEKELSK